MNYIGAIPAYEDENGEIVVDVDGWDDEDEYGGRRRRFRRRRRIRRRRNRRVQRANRRMDRRLARLDSRELDDEEDPEGPLPSRPTGWARTIAGGSVTSTAAGTVTLEFVSQTALDCLDFTATGAAGQTITSIQFGDQIVWKANTGGVDVSNFAPAAGYRGLLEGRKLAVGTTVTILGTATAASEVLSVAILGKKPIGGSC